MHLKNRFIITSLLLAIQAEAFRVTFYLGSQCRGARLGTGSYVYPGYPDVCHNVPPNAISATIEPEQFDGESNSEFYPWPNILVQSAPTSAIPAQYVNMADSWA
jgi:hypothetical protein